MPASCWPKTFRTWSAKLRGAKPLALPTDHPRPATQGFGTARYPIAVDEQVSARLKQLSRRQESTLFMAIAAAFAVVLARYTGQEDICIGTALAGRTRPELEDLIGLFANTVVLRLDLSGNPTFDELLTRVRTEALDVYAHQTLPFEKLVAELRPPRDPSRNPLVQILLVLQTAPLPELRTTELELVDAEIAEGTSNFDLTVSLTEVSGRLQGVIVYAPELFDREPSRSCRGTWSRSLLLCRTIRPRPCRRWGNRSPVFRAPARLVSTKHQIRSIDRRERTSNQPAPRKPLSPGCGATSFRCGAWGPRTISSPWVDTRCWRCKCCGGCATPSGSRFRCAEFLDRPTVTALAGRIVEGGQCGF